jgi:hypothetical protein
VADPLCEPRFPVTAHVPGIDVDALLPALLLEPQPAAKTNEIKIRIKMRFMQLSLTSDDNTRMTNPKKAGYVPRNLARVGPVFCYLQD